MSSIDDIREEQLKEAMALEARGSDPDHIMLLSPEEYAMFKPRGTSYNDGEEDFDLEKGSVDSFPVSQIGKTSILEPYDMGIDSFEKPYFHPVKLYLEATLKAIEKAPVDSLSDSQLESQRDIYAKLFGVITIAYNYYNEDLRLERESLNNPNLNYLARIEFEQDVRAAERIVEGLRFLQSQAQVGINTIENILAEVRGTRS